MDRGQATQGSPNPTHATSFSPTSARDHVLKDCGSCCFISRRVHRPELSHPSQKTALVDTDALFHSIWKYWGEPQGYSLFPCGCQAGNLSRCSPRGRHSSVTVLLAKCYRENQAVVVVRGAGLSSEGNNALCLESRGTCFFSKETCTNPRGQSHGLHEGPLSVKAIQRMIRLKFVFRTPEQKNSTVHLQHHLLHSSNSTGAKQQPRPLEKGTLRMEAVGHPNT